MLLPRIDRGKKVRKSQASPRQRQRLRAHLERQTGESGHSLEGLEINHLVLEPKEVLVKPGPPHDYLYVVCNGLLQLCLEHPGSDPRTVMFYGSGECIVLGDTIGRACQATARHDLLSAIVGERPTGPSPFSLTSVGRSELLQLRAEQVNQRVLNDLLWAKFALTHFTFTGLVLEQQLIDLTTLSREEHYLKLARIAPQVIAGARAKDIATLLGITPEALSRIKARLRSQGQVDANSAPTPS